MSDARLWTTAVVAHAADVVSTGAAFALWPRAAHEGGPLAGVALGAGLVGLAALKTGGLLAAAGVWAAGRRWLAPGHEWLVPWVLGVVGLSATFWNTGHIVARAAGVIG
jgi:hypothetical protein